MRNTYYFPTKSIHTGNKIVDKIINYYVNSNTKYFVLHKRNEFSQKVFKSYKPTVVGNNALSYSNT